MKKKPLKIIALIIAICIICGGCWRVIDFAENIFGIKHDDSEKSGNNYKQEMINPLTGEAGKTFSEGYRPIAFTIGNIEIARPQYGLEQADWLLETEAEGGITRIMAIFTDVDSVPEQIGPVRSARTPFIYFLKPLDGVLCHAGGSETAKSLLAEEVIDHVNALNYDGSYFWRDSYLLENKGMEHSMMTNSENVKEVMAELNIAFQTDVRPLIEFDNVQWGTAEANEIQITMSSMQIINFIYDSSTGLYQKNNGTLDDYEPHYMADGNVIKSSNVIVLYDRQYSENSETIGFDLESGSGFAFSGGEYQPVNWSFSNSGLELKATDGSDVVLNKGKTYICLISDSYKNDLIVRNND